MTDLGLAHDDLIAATHRGFTFLLANGTGWIAAGVLAQFTSVRVVTTLLLVMGAVTTPIAFGLRGVLGFPEYSSDNPLNQLGIMLAFVPGLAIPAVIAAYVRYPLYVPMVMAALLGGHFLPYAWLYQTPVYFGLGIIVSLVPSVMMLWLRERAFALTPVLVGLALIIAAVLVY